MMRLCIATIVPLCALTASIALGESTFPYKAYISADDVYVRSGPGSNYYPTDKLKAGQEVEVYRHDPGGWYAIRPPKGSFAWLSGRFLKLTGDGLGEVTGQQVAARVGSRFSTIRDVIQVRLHRGEAVEVLDAESDGKEPATKKWHKIAPPSGEFRWVFGKFVDPDYPVDGVRSAPANNNPLVAQPPSAVNQHVAQPPSAVNQPPSAVIVQHRQNKPAWSTGSPHTVTVPAEAPGGPASIQPPLAPRDLTPEMFKQQLADTDLELSIMVAEEPTVWTFDALSTRAQSLLAQADTALERGRARVLLGKINRFEDIKQRYLAVNSMWADTERRNGRVAALGRRRGGSDGLSAGEDRFDGRGRLTRVVPPKVGAPRYALVDTSGKVRCYVTPAPGVNLRYYEGRRIGVSGTRGYMPEQHAPHVMAKHVSVLGDGKLR